MELCLTYFYSMNVIGASLYKFSQNRPNNFGDIANLTFRTLPPLAILDFQILRFLVAHQIGKPNMHHGTKFHQNRSNGC